MSTLRFFVLGFLMLALQYPIFATIHVSSHSTLHKRWYDTIQMGSIQAPYINSEYITTLNRRERSSVKSTRVAEEAKTDPLALLSVGVSILSIAAGSVFLALVASTLGFVSFFRIVRHREKRKGLLWATLGILVGFASLFYLLLLNYM